MALYNNSRWNFTFKIRNSLGEPQDLTGRNFVMSLAQQLRGPTDLTLSTEVGTLLIGSETGDLQVFAPYTVIEHLKQGTYYFDIIEVLTGDQLMVASGELNVKSGVK